MTFGHAASRLLAAPFAPSRIRQHSGLWLVVAMFCLWHTSSTLTAQDDHRGVTGLLRKLFGTDKPASAERLLTAADSPLQVSRRAVAINLTNAYQPDGIRYLVISLKLLNTSDTEITVNTQASRLLVGEEELLRVQSREELQNMRVTLSSDEERDVEQLQGEGSVVVPAKGRPAYASLVFARLPRTRELPAMTLRLVTQSGTNAPQDLDLDLTRVENESFSCQLERLGPSGRIGIARFRGELTCLNVSHFSSMIQQYGEQGVSRLVISFDPDSRVNDELTRDWLIEGRESENEILQFYPIWSGLIRKVAYVRFPGMSDETEDHLTSSEADAVQKVSRDFIEGLDSATLRREMRTGHPLFRRAILLNSGDALANEDCEQVLSYLQPDHPEFGDVRIRHAAIRALRSAVDPKALITLESMVRQSPPVDAVQALCSLDQSTLPGARNQAIQLAADPAIQTRLGLIRILKTVEVAQDERWFPLLKSAFESPDAAVRELAMERLLQLGAGDRNAILQSALVDSSKRIRDHAFESLLTERTEETRPLLVQETLARLNAGRHDERTLSALSEIRDPEHLPQLLMWIDKQPDSAMISTYIELGGTAALNEMSSRYSKFGGEIQRQLLQAFFSAHHPDAIKFASEGLLSDDNELYENCYFLLTALGSDQAVTALSTAMEETLTSNISRSQELARGLGAIGSPKAMQILADLKSSDQIHRQKLAAAGYETRQLNSPVMRWVMAANSKVQEGEIAAAIELLNEALKLDDNSSRVHNSLGFAKLRLAQVEKGKVDLVKVAEAKGDFLRSLELDPSDHNPLTGVAICTAIEGKIDEAIGMVDSDEMIRKFGSQQIYLYNVACVYGRGLEHTLQEAESPDRARKVKRFQTQAIRFLNASIEQGFEDITLLSSDGDLDTLRELPEFKKLPGKILERN